MRGRTRGFVWAVALSAAGVVGVASGAAAEVTGQSCDAVFVDHAGILSDADAETVETAAREFRSDVAYEIRVRIMTQEQAPHLQGWVDAEQNACGSWQSSGEFPTNLVILAFTTDNAEDTGETLILYGDQMPDRMDDEWTQIMADTINPALNDGEWVEGITGGLESIRDVIDPPAGNEGVAGVIVVAAGVAVAGGGVVVKRRRRRRGLANRFEQATTELDGLTLKLDPITESLRRDVELIRTALATEEQDTALGEAESLLDTADQHVYQRSELSADRDQLLSKGISEVTTGVGAWESLTGAVRDLLPRLESEEARLAAILAVRSRAPARLGQAESLAADVSEAAARARADGYVIDTDAAVLNTVGERTAEVRRLLDEKRLLATDERLSALVADLEHARDALARLAQRESELRTRLSEIRRSLDGLRDAEQGAADAYTTLTAEFADAVAAPVDDKLADGRESAARAHSSRSVAEESLGARDLGAAENALAETQAALDAAQTHFRDVADRLAQATRLRESIPARHGALKTKLAGVQDAVNRLESAASLRQRAAAVETKITSVDLSAVRPDWFALDDQLTVAEKDLDTLAAEVESARRREEQRRREAERARQRQMSRTYSRSTYSRSWGSGVGSSRSRSRSFGGSGRSTTSRRSSSSRRSSTSRGGSSRGGSTRRRSGGGRRGGSSRR